MNVALLSGLCALTALCVSCASSGPTFIKVPASTTTVSVRLAPACAPLQALGDLGVHATVNTRNEASNWRTLRLVLADVNVRSERLYEQVAAELSGTPHADAARLAAFMPRSRALLRVSRSLSDYRARLDARPGIGAARSAARSLTGTARFLCDITLVAPGV